MPRSTPLSALLLATALGVSVPSAAQLRVVTFNVTNYSSGRVAEFQTILFREFQGRRVVPDVFIGQEFINVGGATTFLNLMNSAQGSPGDYSLANFVAGPDTNSILIYRRSKVTLEGVTTVSVGGTAPRHPRNIMRYDLGLVGYTGLLSKLSVYSSHMKSGTTQSDFDRRLVEAQIIRNDAELRQGRPFLIGGDFNIQSSGDLAYIELTGSQANNAGQFFDPIRTSGNWNNNNGFRFVHTQDPASEMDDRLDFILMSRSLVDSLAFDYLGNPNVGYSNSTWNDPNHSYRSWGNDGTSFNTLLRITGNTMVGPDIAQALVTAANGNGHLPVFLDMRVPPKVQSPPVLDFGRIPVRSVVGRQFPILNSGDVALWTANGIAPLRYTLSANGGFVAPAGQFSAAAGVENRHLITLDASTPGLKTGTLTITSDAPDEPVRVVQLQALVVGVGSWRDVFGID